MELILGIIIITFFLTKEKIAEHEARKYSDKKMEEWRRNNQK